MPRYSFECNSCNTKFSQKLKIGEHPFFSCPNCGIDADRVWEGEGFNFDFAEGSVPVPGNSGVSKHDNPTADQVVGRDSEKRWEFLNARDSVKNELREKGKHHALQRFNVTPDGTTVEYKTAGDSLIDIRKKLVKEMR